MILFVSGEYPPDVGGVGDYTLQLRAALADLGWPSRVLSRRQVRRWDARSLVWLLKAAPRTGIIHIQFQAGAYDLLGDVCLMPVLIRRLLPHARVVTTFHDTRAPYLFPRAGRLRQVALRLLAHSSDAVIAADQRDLQALGGPSPRHYQVPIGPNVRCAPPPGYDRTDFRARLGVHADAPALVYFGLLNASKGLDLLLTTFDRVLARRADARLLLLGGEVGASDPTDRKTAATLRPGLDRFGSRVLRTGWLAGQELSAHLLAGDVAVLPYADGASARRGSLLACAEHGLPIVSTLPAAEEVARFIQPVVADPTHLAEAALRVAADPSIAARLRAASLALAQAMSWPAIAAAHVRIYNRLVYSER